MHRSEEFKITRLHGVYTIKHYHENGTVYKFVAWGRYNKFVGLLNGATNWSEFEKEILRKLCMKKDLSENEHRYTEILIFRYITWMGLKTGPSSCKVINSRGEEFVLTLEISDGEIIYNCDQRILLFPGIWRKLKAAMNKHLTPEGMGRVIVRHPVHNRPLDYEEKIKNRKNKKQEK